MKNIIRILVVACTIITFASCTTSTKVTVYTTPGTEILTVNKSRLAVADGTGKAQIKISDDTYHAFLLSHSPSTNDYVPFALDYKYNSYMGTHALKVLGFGISIVGSATTIVGLLAGNDDSRGTLAGAGLGAGLAGVGLCGFAYSQTTQTAQTNQYKYLSHQTANQDLPITKPVFDEYNAKVVTKGKAPTPTKGSTASKKKLATSSTGGTTTSTKKLGSSASSKTLRDNASKVEGTYVGTGSLTQNGSVIESYNEISITIKKSGKDVVLVNVIEDGEQFFDSDEEYSVRKLSDGKYELTLKGVKTAKITIDTKNNLVYIHPRVNIEGDIYSLSIKAKKQ